MANETEDNEFGVLSEDFEQATENKEVKKNFYTELTPGESMKFIKIPEVGASVEFVIEKVVQDERTSFKKKDGTTFESGLKLKDGSRKNIQLVTDLGNFSISSWELFFKLIGKEGILTKYAETKNPKSYNGCKISITRKYDGSHSSMKTENLMKIIGKNKEQTEAYKAEVAKAMKESKLYLVQLLN